MPQVKEQSTTTQTTKTWTNPYYISKQVMSQLDNGKIAVKRSDQDRVYLITGREGSGKSWLAMQQAYYLDRSFNIDRVCFDSESFANKIRTSKKYQAIIFDEAFNGLASRSALSKENKKLVQLLQECRQRNLFIFIVLPSIFIVDRYVALFRSHALMNTAISRKNYKIRFYKVYNFTNKKLLYLLGQKLMSYSRPKINRMHRFYGKLPPTITEGEYRKKKLAAFKETPKKEEVIIKRPEYQRNVLVKYIHDTKKMSYTKIRDILGAFGVDVDASNLARYAKVLPKTPNYEVR